MRSYKREFCSCLGPGGQNVNKVATAVQLRFDIAYRDCRMSAAATGAMAGKRMTQQGELLITAQRFRTQDRNRQAAMDTLIGLIQRAAEPPTPRIPTNPTAASRRRRLQTKANRARIKQSRSTPTRDED